MARRAVVSLVEGYQRRPGGLWCGGYYYGLFAVACIFVLYNYVVVNMKKYLIHIPLIPVYTLLAPLAIVVAPGAMWYSWFQNENERLALFGSFLITLVWVNILRIIVLSIGYRLEWW